MAKVTFHGIEKEIRVIAGVTDINVKIDLYSDWKEWVLEGNNSKWLPAFNVVGGEPTSAGAVSPTYFFLINGWKMIVDGVQINVASNLYTDNGDTPYVVSNNGTVNAINSDIPGLESSGGTTLDESDIHSALDSYTNKQSYRGGGGGGPSVSQIKEVLEEVMKKKQEDYKKLLKGLQEEDNKNIIDISNDLLKLQKSIKDVEQKIPKENNKETIEMLLHVREMAEYIRKSKKKEEDAEKMLQELGEVALDIQSQLEEDRKKEEEKQKQLQEIINTL